MSSDPVGKADGALKDKLQRLTKLLLLEQKSRQKKSDLELGFTIVNNTHQLCSYSRCIYWKKTGRHIDCIHASGISKIDSGAPFHKQYIKIIKNVVSKNVKKEAHNWARLTEIQISALPEKDAKSLQKHIKDHLLVIEFLSPKGKCFSGLTIENDQSFNESDKALLEHVCESYAHALYSLEIQKYGQRGIISSFLKHKKTSLAFILIIASMFLPVKSSITIPTEIIASDPYVVSAPLEGIVKEIKVSPNQYVSSGQMIALIDDTEIRNKLEISKKEIKVLQADLEQSSRQAFTEKKSKAQIAIIKGKIERQKKEVQYFSELLDKTVLKAPVEGVVVFSDPNKIRGQLFRTGQIIMVIADPDEIKLELRIPSEAMIQFDQQEDIELFLNESPLDVHKAKIDYIEYQATKDPDGLLTYKAYANFNERGETLTIGARGSAKMYGKETILANQIFRRPFVTIRRHLMW